MFLRDMFSNFDELLAMIPVLHVFELACFENCHACVIDRKQSVLVFALLDVSLVVIHNYNCLSIMNDCFACFLDSLLQCRYPSCL